MRRISIPILAFLALPLFLRAADEKPLTSTITHVIVYLGGAQVTRTVTTELSAGTHRLVFKDLSEEADPASIQVSGTGTFTILSVKHRMDHGTEPTGTPEVKELEERIRAIERTIQDEQTRIGILQSEEQRLLKNETITAGEQGTTLEQLRSINDYHRERVTAVRNGIVERQRRIGELRDEAQRVHLQLGQLRAKKPKARSEVLVEVAVPRAVKSTLTLRYVVRSAGWSPMYDVRVASLNTPLDLTYKANVYQSSGEDWNNIRLELASGDPQRDGAMPELATWRLDAGNRPAVVRQQPRAYDASVREVRGSVRDAKTGEALPFVNVVVATADGTALNGAATDFEGYYIVAVPPGGRVLEARYVGYKPLRTDIHANNMDLTLEQDAVELKALEVVQYKTPLIDRDGGASSTTITSESIRKSPGRSVASVATTVAGVSTDTRGARTGNSHYYIDGVKVIAGSVPANYGDVTGGLINIHAPDVIMQRRSTHFAFAIELPYTIPSDGQGHLVAVKEHEVPSVYRHYCVPKLDPAAHLFAKATGWDALDLLPGPINLYYEGTYIGEAFLDSEQVTDTLDIPLGRDRGVVVQRVKEKDLTRQQMTGNKRSEAIAWNIEVRNTRSEPIDLVITDQMPVPVNSEIDVALGKHDATSVDMQRGLLTWRIAVAARSTEKRGFAYTVKAPRRMPLVLE